MGSKSRFPGCKWLDLGQLSAQLFPRDTINRIRYFTARVSARPGDLQQPMRQQAYLRALGTIPNLSIHEGQFRTHEVRMRLAQVPPGGPATACVLKTEEKGSDVNLASFLLLDAFRGDCDAAAVISNDSDLATPLRIARDELGLTTGVVNPHPRNRRSNDMDATFFKQLTGQKVRSSQFPETLTDANGTIRKPRTW